MFMMSQRHAVIVYGIKDMAISVIRYELGLREIHALNEVVAF